MSDLVLDFTTVGTAHDNVIVGQTTGKRLYDSAVTTIQQHLSMVSFKNAESSYADLEERTVLRTAAIESRQTSLLLKEHLRALNRSFVKRSPLETYFGIR